MPSTIVRTVNPVLVSKVLTGRVAGMTVKSGSDSVLCWPQGSGQSSGQGNTMSRVPGVLITDELAACSRAAGACANSPRLAGTFCDPLQVGFEP